MYGIFHEDIINFYRGTVDKLNVFFTTAIISYTFDTKKKLIRISVRAEYERNSYFLNYTVDKLAYQ